MRAHAKPNPAHSYNATKEIKALRSHRDTGEGRAIPAAGPDEVLLATWNIANLGVHDRRPNDYKLLAEMVSWFELVAIQEVADNLDGLYEVLDRLPSHYDTLFSDKAGNEERAAFIYDTTRISPGPKIGEIDIIESECAEIKLPGVNRKFGGFNRNPYLASFSVDDAVLLLANAHLFYGTTESAAATRASMEQRMLEAYAIGRWCDLRRASANRFTSNILALGDFNIPEAATGDVVFDSLTRRGLMVADHTTRLPGTNLAGDHAYDQIAFVPGLKKHVRAMGVFDFDTAVFSSIWDPNKPSRFRACTRYYLSDHRPLWMLLALPPEG